jgi:hypothetical protein
VSSIYFGWFGGVVVVGLFVCCMFTVVDFELGCLSVSWFVTIVCAVVVCLEQTAVSFLGVLQKTCAAFPTLPLHFC